jgi:tungstate transport system substrate-binding protein
MIRLALLRSLLFLGSARAQSSVQVNFITLSSTTPTQDSGLFGQILPPFRAASGLEVHVLAVGTGQALVLGMRGDADALLVHDRAGEDKYVAEGYGIDRRAVMYNDFVIVGPKSDPAGIRSFCRIATARALCASRGDDSGTNRMELRLRKSAGIEPDKSGGWDWDLGQGTGPTLNIAAALDAYRLTDRANFKNRPNLEILTDGRHRPVQPLRQHSGQSRQMAAPEGCSSQGPARMADFAARPRRHHVRSHQR